MTSMLLLKEARASIAIDGTTYTVDDAGPGGQMTHSFPEPVQWFKNGDHPNVRSFRRPDVPGETVCGICGHTAHDHGWVDSGGDGQTVCPGDTIEQDADGAFYRVQPPRHSQ